MCGLIQLKLALKLFLNTQIHDYQIKSRERPISCYSFILDQMILLDIQDITSNQDNKVKQQSINIVMFKNKYNVQPWHFFKLMLIAPIILKKKKSQSNLETFYNILKTFQHPI